MYNDVLSKSLSPYASYVVLSSENKLKFPFQEYQSFGHIVRYVSSCNKWVVLEWLSCSKT